MASQPAASAEINSFSSDSFVRGYHVYMDQWEPWIGDILPLEREPTNPEDKCTVAVKKCGRIVGHVPFNIALLCQRFWKERQTKDLWKSLEVKSGYFFLISINWDCKMWP